MPTSHGITNVPFGLQFCDASHVPGEERFGTEIPVRKTQKTAPETTVPVEQNVPSVVENSHVPEQEEWVEMPDSEFPEQTAMEPLQTTDQAEVPDSRIEQADQSPAPASDGVAASAENKAVPVTERASAETPQGQNPEEDVPAVADQRAIVTEFPAETVRGEAPAEGAEEPPAERADAPRYTPDMPVEEILSMMTLEEAQNLIVDVGTCSGWTMAQVADRRAASLKWYVYGYKGDNNILRAAAQMMLEFSTAQKAS